jgi:hypothetical protein
VAYLEPHFSTETPAKDRTLIPDSAQPAGPASPDPERSIRWGKGVSRRLPVNKIRAPSLSSVRHRHQEASTGRIEFATRSG